MRPNVFDVHTLEKMLLAFDYVKTTSDKRYKSFEHKLLRTITIGTTGAYTKNQVCPLVMEKMGINSYDKFCELYKHYHTQ